MQWILLREQKPELEQRVLVAPTKGRTVISKLILAPLTDDRSVIWEDDDGKIFGINSVEYWMEIPEKP